MSKLSWNDSRWKPASEDPPKERRPFKDALVGQQAVKTFEEAWPELRGGNSGRRFFKKGNPKGKGASGWKEPSEEVVGDEKVTISSAADAGQVQIVVTPDIVLSDDRGPDAEDFPALNEAPSRKRRTRTESEVEEKPAAADGPEEAPVPKKPHKKDPISVDILKAIQLTLLRRMKKKQTKAKEKITQRLNRGGNSLDSSRPAVMRRGKVRFKKKRMSRIKQAIIVARLMRKLRPSTGGASDADPYLRELLGKAVQNLTREFYKARCIPIPQKDNRGTAEFEMDDSSTPMPENDAESMAEIKKIIHSRKFRPYCVNFPTKELRESARSLVVSLREFQDRVYKNEPLKFKLKRRFTCGFKETIKYLRFGELKLVIVATNLEIQKDDPMDEMMQNIIETARRSGVPCAFIGTAQDLGYWTGKKGRISIIGVLNYMGAEDAFKNVPACLEAAKIQYNEKIALIKRGLGLDSPKDKEKEVEDMIQATMIMKLTSDDGNED